MWVSVAESDIPDLVALLRKTLAQLQMVEDLRTDDPTQVEFEDCITHVIAELQRTEER